MNSALGDWLGAWGDDAVIVGQLGEALSLCTVGLNSSEVVEFYIIPRLQTVLRGNTPSDRLELLRSVEELISIAPNLKKLHFLFPVWISMWANVSRLSLCIIILTELKF